MAGSNGQAGTATTAALEVAAKITLDPDLLNSRDMLRARVVLEGRNPYEVLDDPLERVPLIVWCLVTRDDPSFTWDQALDMPFSRLQFGAGDEPDPPTGPPGSPGPASEPPPASGSKPRRRAGGSAPNSPASTG